MPLIRPTRASAASPLLGRGNSTPAPRSTCLLVTPPFTAPSHSDAQAVVAMEAAPKGLWSLAR
eukprot:4656293-Pleurochrysis_carterae.AAC.1